MKFNTKKTKEITKKTPDDRSSMMTGTRAGHREDTRVFVVLFMTSVCLPLRPATCIRQVTFPSESTGEPAFAYRGQERDNPLKVED